MLKVAVILSEKSEHTYYTSTTSNYNFLACKAKYGRIYSGGPIVASVIYEMWSNGRSAEHVDEKYFDDGIPTPDPKGMESRWVVRTWYSNGVSKCEICMQNADLKALHYLKL